MKHSHDHDHGDSDGRGRSRKRLIAVFALTAAYMMAEIVGGILSNSLALLADAGHMLTDVAALGLSVFALWAASRPPTARYTYGFYRGEILAALANGATLIAIALLIFVEAYKRLSAPPEVAGSLVAGVAVGGLVVNLLGLWILRGGRGESLNVRGAWLHVVTDALGSVGALASGAVIWAFGWRLADPIASVLIGLLVIYSSWALFKEAASVLLESAPTHVDVEAVRVAIVTTPGVAEVHDLHVWTISSGMDCLSCHVVPAEETNAQPLLVNLGTTLRERFGIAHTTIQMEAARCARDAQHV